MKMFYFLKLGVTVSRFAEGGSRRNRGTVRSSYDVIEKMWDCVRSNNGIRVGHRSRGH